jgi:hypothetical protein
MKLSPKQREEIRMMFGGKCAYCGCELSGKWHVDHCDPVERESKWDEKSRSLKQTGKMLSPHNDRLDNLFPACIKCNILKGNARIESFRGMFAYMVCSIPKIRTYSHVHHLMRFGKLHIDSTPVVFWFETYRLTHAVGTGADPARAFKPTNEGVIE